MLQGPWHQQARYTPFRSRLVGFDDDQLQSIHSPYTARYDFHVIKLLPVAIFNRVCLPCHHLLLLRAYPLRNVVTQMSLQNRCLSSTIILAVAIVPTIYVMYFSHLCIGFPPLLFPATIPCIIVFSKPVCQVTWPKYLSFYKVNLIYKS